MELTFVSCNIRFDNPADGVHSWTHRRLLLAEILRTHSPDIISTQEGRYDQLKDFESVLKDYVLIDEHRSWIKERMYPTIFIKKDRFEFIRSEDLWLSETPQIAGSLSFDSAFPRLMTWATVQPKNSKKKILIVNAHLDHLKRETRESQVSVLTQEVRKIHQDQQILAIMGDFNDSPVSSVRSILMNDIEDLTDGWALFHSEEETSHHPFTGVMKDGSRIDWILVKGAAQILDCKLDKSSRNGKWPSDHFPVVCKIKI